ncbi:MAG: response regulator [Oscillatoriophycideae cyanobacterium NC_groundwater_1537_Pr4_S-0.65um_50_18]|nr:response regulator [Oscillatoriophycideae cyanobacterium NC_groundwater_1537_Pr4_S-0.65um_50_18]
MTQPVKILLVEDDTLTAEAIVRLLAVPQPHHPPYKIDVAEDGQIGLEWAKAIAYDLIILDVILPKLDGIRLCQELRLRQHTVPILLLTAKNGIPDKVAGLEVGADDYMVKPFDPQELRARIRVLLRRNQTPFPLLTWGDLCLNSANHEVSYGEQALTLTHKEYQLLELFLQNSHRVFSRSALIENLWAIGTPPTEGTVTTHIMSLRRKLKLAGADAELIETVYGTGYRLKPLLASPPIAASGADLPSGSVPHEISQPQQTHLAIARLWEELQDKVKARLPIFDQVLVALQTDQLTLELQHQAAQEAHRLAGSLGIFGFTQGSDLARSLEALLSDSNLTHAQGNAVMKQITKLRQALNLAPPKPHLGQITAAPILARPNLAVNSSRPTVLLVDDDANLAQQLCGEAHAWNIQLESVLDLAAARVAIAHQPPDAILLDLNFAHSPEDGFDLLAELATQRPPIPTLVYTGKNELSDRLKTAQLGGQAFLTKNLTSAQVLAAVTQVLQQSTLQKIGQDATLLIVDDTEEDLAILHTLLQPWGFRLVTISQPQQFWEVLESTQPDLLILDVMMPGIDGIELCRVVRNDSSWSRLPIVFLSAHTDSTLLQRLFAIGANDFLSKPIEGSVLIPRILNRLASLTRQPPV